jgi:hypothetical protein
MILNKKEKFIFESTIAIWAAIHPANSGAQVSGSNLEFSPSNVPMISCSIGFLKLTYIKLFYFYYSILDTFQGWDSPGNIAIEKVPKAFLNSLRGIQNKPSFLSTWPPPSCFLILSFHLLSLSLHGPV